MLKKYYSVASWPHWMMPLSEHLHQKLLDMKVGAKVWMFLLHFTKNHDPFTSLHRKIYLMDLPPKNTPILQLLPCSAPPNDLLRRWYILTYIIKPLIWRWHTGSPLTQHSKRRRWWHGRTLPNSISWRWFLGWKNLFHRGTYAYMKMPNMIHALNHAHTTWICYTLPKKMTHNI